MCDEKGTAYLDNAATTKIRKEVREAMEPYLEESYGNASALYGLGMESRKAINRSRNSIASALGCKPGEIYFTSGGSEANNWAIKSPAMWYSGGHIIISAIEHKSVLNTVRFLKSRGYSVTMLQVDAEGRIDVKEVERNIRTDTFLISVMYANNEIGTIQPIREIGELCDESPILFHTDAVQAIPHRKLDVEELKVDLLSFSGHKMNGPKGIGALYIKEGLRMEPLIHGGSQELGRRAGTENTAAIVGMAKALELARREMEKDEKKYHALSTLLYEELRKRRYDFIINGKEGEKLESIINICFKNIDGRVLAMHLGKRGIYVSNASACNSESVLLSHVLQAIRTEEEYIQGAIRISLGNEVQESDIYAFLENLDDIFTNYKETILMK